MSEVNIVGNLTRDPILRFTNSGKPVATIDVAVNRWAGPDKDPPPPVFVEVTAWDALGQNCADSLTKGMAVIVLGELKLETWGEEGDKRSKLKVTAREVGASLRFATAQVTRTPKAGEGGGRASRAQPATQQWAEGEEEPF